MDQLTGTVVVEKGVQACSVDEDVLRVEDSEAPCVLRCGEDRVVEGTDGWEGSVGTRIGLVVPGIL